MSARSFAIGDDDFLLDGEPFQVISGALHYFRVHPDLWADRLCKARQMGLNTVETYVAWNYHSSAPGEFVTEGSRDLGRFIDLAAEAGLLVIVRPGPYICAEWVDGGLPAWLLATPGIRLRSADPAFLEHVAEYYRMVFEVVAPRLVSRDGPVIALQIENEYGAFGDDLEYLGALKAWCDQAGVDVPLLTCDQANDEMLGLGEVPGVHKTATFGSRTGERLAALRRHQPTGPLMCMEFWNGWFDSWGRPHHTTDAGASARELDTLLSAGASVNLYMFHGGTNFGLTNGANHKGAYVPITTSYDYDAPLAEDGSPTDKYWALRDVIGKHSSLPDDAPAERVAAPEPDVTLTRAHDWTDLAQGFGPMKSVEEPLMLESLQVGTKMAHFRAVVSSEDLLLVLEDVRDRAIVMVDGLPIAVVDRTDSPRVVALPARDAELSILVEDQGGVNYGPRLGENKGLVGEIRTNARDRLDWVGAPLELDDLHRIVVPSLGEGRVIDAVAPVAGPVLVRGTFAVRDAVDHFLRLDAWTKGFVWINGFLLGRYWNVGPTRTLYVPGPVLTRGANSIDILELHGAAFPTVRFDIGPDLGHDQE